MTVDLEPKELTVAKNRVHELLDGEFYNETFFEETEDGPVPDFIGLADKIIEDLVEAGVQIPETIEGA